MAKSGFDDDSLIDIASVRFDDVGVSPSTPGAGQKKVFVKSDELKQLNSSGTERYVGDKITVSANDTTSDYISSKLVAGTGVTLTELNDGANETFRVTVNNTVGSSRFGAPFGAVGNASNKFLEYFRSIPSDSTGLVVAESSEVVAISVAVKVNATCTFTVYKNAVALTTISLSAERTNSVSSLALSVVADDEISVAITSGSCQDPIVSLFLKVLLP